MLKGAFQLVALMAVIAVVTTAIGSLLGIGGYKLLEVATKEPDLTALIILCCIGAGVRAWMRAKFFFGKEPPDRIW